jgi:hypothetical protein
LLCESLTLYSLADSRFPENVINGTGLYRRSQVNDVSVTTSWISE